MPSTDTLPDLSWAAAAQSLSLEQAAYQAEDRYATLVLILAKTNALVHRARSSLRQRFQDLDEADFVAMAKARRRLLEDDRFGWPVDPSDPVGAMLAAAAQVRAVDELLHEEREHGLPADPNIDWACPEADSYVIPRRRQRANKRALTNQPFRRRAMLYHRIVPMTSGGYRVRLHALDAVGDPAATTPPPLGAAMFRDLAFTYDEEPIVVREVDCTDVEGAIRHQLDSARQAGCLAVVWAEMCISPAYLARIEAGLRERPLAHAGSPSIAVAGSWHEEGPDGVVNVMSVLDGFGDTVLRYHKILPYRTSGGEREGIVSGEELPVLVLDDLIVAFAICRDFCERNEAATVLDLDVDAVIVPSLGDAATLQGHVRTAADMDTRFNARSFIVQQALPNRPHLLGWVVDGGGDPIVQTAEFVAYPA